MKTFEAYRPFVPHETHTEFQRNAEDQVQYEGCIFSDGRVAIRWLTAKGSTSVFDSMQDCMDIHGHSEYGTYLIWGDGRIENYVGDGKFEPRTTAESISFEPAIVKPTLKERKQAIIKTLIENYHE